VCDLICKFPSLGIGVKQFLNVPNQKEFPTSGKFPTGEEPLL